MASEGILRSIPGISASADLSAKQFCFAIASGDRTATVASALTDCPLGVIQNAPEQYDAVDIASAGVTKVLLGGSVSAGNQVGTDTNGAAVAKTVGADVTHYVRGIMLEGGSAGEVRAMLLVDPHRAS